MTESITNHQNIRLGDIPALVINLDASVQRLSAFRRSFEGLLSDLIRVPAIEGSRLPQAAVSRLVSRRLPATKWSGALGCTLSHLAALQIVTSRGYPLCLILEDDARPAADFNSAIRSLELPSDFDVCFVNQGMARTIQPTDSQRLVTVSEAVVALPPPTRAPGAYGYVISAKGATLLSKWFEEDGLGSFYDWRILAYGVISGSLDGSPDSSTVKQIVSRLHERYPRKERLCAYVRIPHAIEVENRESDIQRESGNGDSGILLSS